LAHWGQTSGGLPRSVAEAIVAEGVSRAGGTSLPSTGPDKIGLAGAAHQRKFGGPTGRYQRPADPDPRNHPMHDPRGSRSLIAPYPKSPTSDRLRQGASERDAQEAARLVGRRL
jgi:hypothetical protein